MKRLAWVLAAVPLVLVACGTSGDGADKTVATTAAATESTTGTVGTSTAGTAPAQTPAAATTAGTTPTAANSPNTAGKVSANNASIAELTAAFDAAGIANGSRWAREVYEYRPYDVSDPTMAKLRQNLAKYNPGPGVVDAIIAVLSLP